MMKPCLFPMLILLLPGCSNQQIYDNIQHNQRMECGKLPQSQYEECMREHDTPFEDYDRQRQAAIDDEAAQ